LRHPRHSRRRVADLHRAMKKRAFIANVLHPFALRPCLFSLALGSGGRSEVGRVVQPQVFSSGGV
jgi:hypothetical protein